MQTETRPTTPLHAGNKTYISLPPEVEEARIFSLPFILFALVLLSGATFAGLVKSGRVSLGKGAAQPAAVAPAAGAPAASTTSTIAAAVHAAPASVMKAIAHASAPAATPAPAFSAGTFVVTSISIGQTNIAIINGASRQVGDAVNAPGVTGWTVYRIDEDKVWLRNGPTVSAVEMTAQGLNALDDTLHPLN